MPSIFDPSQGFSPGIQGYNIEQTPSPGGLAPALAPMTVGMSLESKIQDSMIRRGLTGGRGISMGGADFRRWLASDGAQSLKTVFGNPLPSGQSLLDAAATGAKTPRLEAVYRRFLNAGAKGKVVGTGPARALGRGLGYSGTMLISDAIMPVVRMTQNAARINKLRPRAARYGVQVARANPLINWSNKGASYKGEPMKKKANSNLGMLGASILASVIGSGISDSLGQDFAEKRRDRKREMTIGRNWNKLINRYPEFNRDDRAERDEVMDIFEGLHAMSPDITSVPVLTAPLLRNALEYGMKGFSAADMKTLTDIGFKMKAPSDSGVKLMPKVDPSMFGGGND